MTMLRIPWPEGPSWRQTLTLGGRIFTLRGRWNEIGEFWSFDIATRDGVDIVNGVKVVPGVLLTSRHAESALPAGYFFVATTSDCGCTPGLDDMQSNARLIYVPFV